MLSYATRSIYDFGSRGGSPPQLIPGENTLLLGCLGIISGVTELQLCYQEHLDAPKKIYPGPMMMKTTSGVN